MFSLEVLQNRWLILALGGGVGLVLAMILAYTALESILIAGDVVLTRDHFESSDLGEMPWDLEKAKVSFQDVMEIADQVVPGHDNVFVCRAGGGML
jgi:glyoxylase-like metal-dependent hydrolase (beta-lactamase superfamily II)